MFPLLHYNFENKEQLIFELILKPLIEAYNIVKFDKKIVIDKEPVITDKLVRCLKNKTSISEIYRRRSIYIVMGPKEQNVNGIYEPDIKFIVGSIIWMEIEAKRIYEENNNWSISKYFNKEIGIGRFLYEIYSQNEDHGGMIGYIQNGNFQNITQKIKSKLVELSYKECENIEGIENSLLSFHHRSNKGDIKLYHLFFYFS